MFKLIRYEFRKNRSGLLIMLLVALGLYLMAPLGKLMHKEALIVISFSLLTIYAVAAYAYVLVRGIAAYANELKTRTGYLLMMVPRSTMSILFAKLLFTLFFALVMLGICVLALSGAGSILMREIYGARSLVDMLRLGMLQLGLTPASLVSTALFFVAEILSSVLAVVSVGYLSTTLSATVLKQGKMREWMSALIFVLLFIAMSMISNWIGMSTDEMIQDVAQAMRAAFPVVALDLALTALFTALSAILLQKKVSL